MNIHGKRILITGAAGGIGKMLALALARKGIAELAARQREVLTAAGVKL